MGGTVLRDVRIVDASAGAAARLAATALCDLGADGVRLAALDGGDAVLDRGRRHDRATAHDRVAWARRADLWIDDGDAGEVDFTAVREQNPGLIRLSILAQPGIGLPSGAAAGAACGVYAPPVGRRPRWTPVPIVDTVAGLYGAVGAVAALIARDRDGRGQDVTVSLDHAALAAMELLLAMSDRPPSAWPALQWAATPFVGAYRCADGAWVYVHFGLARHVAALVALLEREVPDLGRELATTLSPGTRADPSQVAAPAEATRIADLLRRLFSSRPAEAWEAWLGGEGLCCVVARTGDAWRDHSHARRAGHVIAIDDPIAGAVDQPGAWVRSGDRAPAPRRAGRPRWGARAGAVGKGCSDPPLAGVRVLDFTQVIAGPVAARTLAELGADVIRVENPGFDPGWSEAFHCAFSAGKRSVAVALDADVAGRLVAGLVPDVVVSSWRPGVASRLGLDPAALSAIPQGPVSVRVSAYGEGGPWDAWRGWEQTAQAASGMQMDHGDGAPELLPVPVNDLCTGLAAALGAVAGVHARARGEESVDVAASLVRTATWLQRDALARPDGRVPPDQRGASLGAGATARFARARDGWVWIEGALDRVPGLEDVDLDDRAAVDARLATATVDRWCRSAAGIAGVAVVRYRRATDAAREPGSPAYRERHAGIGAFTRVASPLRMSRTPGVEAAPAHRRGIDGAELLLPLGLRPEPPWPERSDAIGSRIRRRAAWAASGARWGAWLAWSRLGALAIAPVLGLAACGGGSSGAVPPVAPFDAPFEVIGNSDVTPGTPGSATGLGLSAEASAIREIAVGTNADGQLSVAWRGEDVRVRAWDGSRWSDDRVSLRGDDKGRARAWEYAVVPDGVMSIGPDLPGAKRLPRPDLQVLGEGGIRLHEGPVDGAFAVDPEGRLVWAVFAGPRVQVWRWKGSEWEQLGEDDPPKGYRSGGRLGPAIGFGEDGQVLVAWRQSYTVMPRAGGRDKYKATRWRTWVRRWDGSEWETLAGDASPLDEDPTERYPQAAKVGERNLRADWTDAQDTPPKIATTSDGDVVVAWDTYDGIETWSYNGVSWEKLPQVVDLPGDAEDIDLVPYRRGVALAWAHAWIDGPRRAPREIQVRTWDGSAWAAPGSVRPEGASNTLGPSSSPRLAVVDDQLVVAWVDATSGAPELLLARHDGAAWSGVPVGSRSGGLGLAGHGASLPQVVIARGGPIVAWVDEATVSMPPGPAALVAASWDGTSWTTSELTVSARPFQLELQARGDSVLALWDQRLGSGPKGLYVARYGPGGWEQVHGAGPGGAIFGDASGAYEASLAVDEVGMPWVAWSHSGRPVRVRQYAEGNWAEVGKVPGQTVTAFAPQLAISPRGRPWLAWAAASSNRDTDVKVAWFDGTAWQPAGESWWLECEPNVGGPPPVQAELAIGPDERPVVAWLTAGGAAEVDTTAEPKAKAKAKSRADKRTPPALHVCAWNGKAWDALPDPVEGATIRVSDSRRSAFVLTAVDAPTVMWTEQGDAARNVRGSWWDGGRWVPIGANRGDVSDCDGACWSPALAVGDGLRCAAWEEMADRGRAVSLRCQRN